MKKILIVNASNRRRGNSFALEDYLKKKLEGKAEVKTLETVNQKVRNDTKINETFSHARFSVNYCSL